MCTCNVCNGRCKCMKQTNISSITSKKSCINFLKKHKLQIQTLLADWLINIQQQDPLPFEITNIYFILDFSNNDIELSFSASDINLLIFDYGFYQPLEAEYFYCSYLKQLAQKVNIKKSKDIQQQVFLFLKQICFDVGKSLDFLKNKNLFFGKRFDIIINNNV